MVDYASIGILLAHNYRSRAILQMLLHSNIRIGGAILLPGVEPAWEGEETINLPLYRLPGTTFSFKPGCSIQDTLKVMGVGCRIAPTADINSPEFIDFIRETPETVYLYSGLAGCILRPPLLRNSGKKFIHAHGGDAPRYSGSTAFYYSILERGEIGATVFWMDEGLDTGDVICKLKAKPHAGIGVDYIQDPVIRAEAMIWSLEQLDHHQALQQAHSGRVTYHVIHPVLKHYALKRIGLGKA